MNDIKKLRTMTGAGILDCQKALKESNGDLNAAVDFLRKKGLSKAAKKADRTAFEGVIALHFNESHKGYGMVELNCETDFVARNEAFKESAAVLAEHALAVEATSAKDFLASQMDNDKVEVHVQSLISKFGENTVVGNAYSQHTTGFFDGYVHSNGKLAVVVEVEGDANEANKTLVRDIAMHIAAMSPAFLDENSVDNNVLSKEREIYRAELENSGKPEQVIDRIVDGKINKYLENACLVHQKFVKDPNVTISQHVEGKVEILSFRRFVLGEN